MISATSKINILLVDDRVENLLSLTAVLDSPEYNLVTANSGEEALRCVLNSDFALILMDVQMPVLDGFETAALIRQRERSKNIPIIFVTAISKDEPFICKGYLAGAVDYLFKPFDPLILRSKVHVFAELERKTMQIQKQAELLRQTELAKLEFESLERENATQRKYMELVEGINQGIVWAGDYELKNFSFVSSKAFEVAGYPTEKWIAEPHFWINHVFPEDREAVMAQIKKGTEETKNFSFEHRFLKADGDVIWLQTSVRVVRPSSINSEVFNAAEAGLRGLSVDVTRLKKAEETAQAAVKLRDDFLAIASHELKTPLTALKLQTEILNRSLNKEELSLSTKERVNKMLGSTNRQVNNLAKLIDNLLDVTRIVNGKLTLHIQKVNILELVNNVVERFREQFQIACCEVKTTSNFDLVSYCDQSRIEQVIVNLCSNAVKYGSNRPISIAVEQTESVIRIAVQDQGMGISREDQTRIFDRFARAKEDGAISGLGLGLYIVKQILNAHGGKIWVDSELGKGSTFTVELPLNHSLIQLFQIQSDMSI